MARGRYSIVRKLAQGGMAEIFLAAQRGAEGFERPVVLKRILPELSADPHFCNGLIDEAHIAMGLNHSNIVQVLDLGKSRKRYFLVMEFVDGWDLNALTKRAAAAGLELPPGLALFITAEVCRALSYAHAKQSHGQPLLIVHRDVSPHNILVSEQGEVKLTDFGIAKALGKRDKTSSGVIKGKIAFMAPEQADTGKVDARSDLFSLGATLYAVVTRKRPFDAKSDIEMLLRVRDARFDPPEKVRPDLDPQLCRFIRKAMERSPSARFQTAEEMLLEAERVLRTSLGGPGQTELKRWIAALAAKDGAQSAGKTAPPVAVRPPPLPLETDSDDGIIIELEEADLEEFPEDRAAGVPPHEPTLGDRPSRMERRPSVLRAGLATILVGLAGYLAYSRLILPSVIRAPPRDAGALSAPLAAGPDAAMPLDAAAPDIGAPEPDVDASEAGPDARLEPPDAARAAGPDAQAVEPEVTYPAAPDSGARAAPVTRHVADASIAAARVGKEAGEEGTVSVHFVTDPPGATIRIEKRTFGPTPMHLRFHSGITYELNFTKDGYAPLRRLVTVSDRPDQAVTVKLVKDKASPGPVKPPPGKH
jgi:serine/threonine-protein kinase